MAIASPLRLWGEKRIAKLGIDDQRECKAQLILIANNYDDNYVCTRVDRFLVICWLLSPSDQTAIVCNRNTSTGINIPVICINYHGRVLFEKKKIYTSQAFKIITHVYFFNRLRNLSLLNISLSIFPAQSHAN